jgi:hypothetical protein
MDCSICLESLNDGRPTTLFCQRNVAGVEQGHIFHNVCIQGWINTNIGQPITCPLCRAPIAVEVLQELPENFWNPITIIFNGSLILIKSALVATFAIGLQRWAEYNHASSIELAALQQYARTLERFQGPSSTESMGNLTMNRYLHRVSQVQLNSTHGQLQENVKTLIGLLMLLLIVNIFKKIRTLYRGGGNTLSINGDSIEIPTGFEHTVKEAFSSLKKIVAKRGGCKTRRR